MLDTSLEIQKKLDEIYSSIPGEQKLLMALQMFDTVRKIVISSLPKDLSNNQLRKQLFLRFYGNDFSEEEKEKILSKF